MADVPTARRNLHHERGNACFRRKQYADALTHYTRAIQTELQNPALFSNRAACEVMLGKFPDALQDSEKAVSLCVDWHKGHFWRGVVLKELGKYTEARDAFLTAAQAEPDHTETTRQLSEVLLLLGEDPNSVSSLKLLLPPPTSSSAYSGRGKKRGRSSSTGPVAAAAAAEEDAKESKIEPSLKKRLTPAEATLLRREEKKKVTMLQVDTESGLAKKGKILVEGKEIYNVDLFKQGQNCRLSIIEVPYEGDPTKSKFHVWFIVRWLVDIFRPPQSSLTQLTREEAITVFLRMFRDRTGRAWEDRFRKSEKMSGKCNWKYVS